MSKEAFLAFIGSDKREKLEKVLCAIVISAMFLLFLKSVLDRYRLYPWFNLPLGWDPVMYLGHVEIVKSTGFMSYIFSGQRFSLYFLTLFFLDDFIDISQVEIVLPVILLIVYSLISFLIVFRISDSLWLATPSIFLTLFNIRGSKFLGLFHINMTALIFFLSFIYVSSREEEYLAGQRDYLAITLFFMVSLTHPFTSFFIIGSLPILLLYNYSKMKNELTKVKTRKKHLLLTGFYLCLIFFLNLGYLCNILSAVISPSRNVLNNVFALPDPWFHMVGINDYLFILNYDMLSLLIIVFCNIYLIIKFRDNPLISYISIFSFVSFIFPLLQLIFPLYIPPKRITMLNQYQVIIPLALYGLKKDLRVTRLKLSLTGKSFGLTQIFNMLSIIVIAYLFLTSWGIYGNALRNDMIPWIKEYQYDGLISVSEYRESYPLEDLVIVYYPESPEYLSIHIAYTYVMVGESHFYLGKTDDAINLVPPEELNYLAPLENDRAANLYYGGLNPLSESRDSEHTMALIRGFSLNSLSKGTAIGKNAAIIKIGEAHQEGS